MSLPIGNYTPFSITYLDQSRERSSIKGYATLLDATNFDDQQTLFVTFVAAAADLVLGELIQREYGIKDLFADGLPGTNLAQREDKLLVSYRDSVTGKPLNMSIPTAKLSAIVYQAQSTKGYIVLADGGVVADFVTAFEAFVIAPLTGNATEVMAIRFKGANN
jgi:hypothetical protein